MLLACVPAASAQQAAWANASAPPGVLYVDCVDHAADYAVSVDPPETDWFLALEVHRADGSYVAGNYRSKPREPASDKMGPRACGSVLPRVIPTVLPTNSPCPGPLAQLAEQRTFNPRVVGSSPTGPTEEVRHAAHH